MGGCLQTPHPGSPRLFECWVVPAPAERFPVRGGKGLRAGMGLSGLTWGLLHRVDAPVSGGDGVPRCAGVRRVPCPLREVPACGPDRGCGSEPVWGSEIRGKPSHDLSKPGGACSSLRPRYGLPDLEC